ncbi:hypothetical protein [Nocardioides sp. SYSU DS0663]|uniref:hypothetical protein n=1 Tax=Nocardioides sp. SYSU DS0663 TaxID=3416445 RepID=UPI003F4C2977
MPSYDFEVDLQSLVAAAQGLADAVRTFKDADVEDLVPSEGDLGSEVVWSAVEEFRNRWEEGMNNLCHDVEEMSGRLGRIAMNYAENDTAGRDAMARARADVAATAVLGG